jgi:hypothetical protein
MSSSYWPISRKPYTRAFTSAMYSLCEDTTCPSVPIACTSSRRDSGIFTVFPVSGS